MHQEEKMHKRGFPGKSKEREHLEIQGLNGRILNKS
jgi:hypothetical protein